MTGNRDQGGRGAAGFVALGCVGFVASFAAPAQAQDAAGEPVRLQGVTVTDTAIGDDYSVEEVQSPKVTAPLLDTPRTVDVITRDVLEDTASFSFEEALRTVPGITLGAGEGGVASADIPLIRGVDATADTYVDGARDVGSQTRETFAVERIEVFKGPTGALGGRGSAGGAINIVSRLPERDSFAAGQATIGTSDFRRITADVNQMLTDNVGFRVNALWHDADIPGRDAVHEERWGFAPSVTLGLGGPTRATLAYYHYETEGIPDYGIPLTSRDQLPGGRREPADVDFDNFYGLLARDFQETQVDSVTFLFEHDFENGWMLSDTARWSRARNNYIVTNPDDSAGNVANGAVWRAVKSRDSVNQSLVNNLNLAGDFDTGGIGHSIALGFELSASDTDRYSYTVDTGDRTCPTFADFNCAPLGDPDPTDPWTGAIALGTTPNLASVEDYSLYAFDTVTIAPQLLLNGGIRWTHFSVSASGSGRGGSFVVDTSSEFFTWQAGAVFKPSENASLYVSYADSATPPGADVGEGSTGVSSGNQNYEPQTYENWEAGGKLDLVGGALRLTAAVFQIDRSNIRDIDPNTGDSVVIADQARIRGFEIGASGRLGPLSLLAGYSFIDSELRNGGPNDGNSLPNTPEHNLALTADLEVTDRFSVGAGVYAASERYADTANLIRADGYWRADAHAGFRINDNLDLRLNVQNVFDERYVVKLRNPHFAVPSEGVQGLLTLSAVY